MSIDLFANYERASNSSVFYRPVKIGNYSAIYRLADLDNPGLNIPSQYYADYRVNSSGSFLAFPVNSQNEYVKEFLFPSSAPGVHSVEVRLKTLDQSTIIETFKLDCQILYGWPTAEYALFPEQKLTLDISGNIISTSLNVGNYAQSLGNSFYGEGHTEKFTLYSDHGTFNNYDVFIGTPPWVLKEKAATASGLQTGDSFVSVSRSGATTTFQVSTTPAEHSTYPVSMMAYDSNINNKSPLITYGDIDGIPRYYSYFYSSHLLDGSLNSDNTTWKSEINVLPYDISDDALVFTTSCNNEFLYLPLDFSPQTFTAEFIEAFPTSLITETFKESTWATKGSTETSSWGFLDNFTLKGPLTGVTLYSFDVTYDKSRDGILNYYTASTTEKTTLTIEASGTTTLVLSAAPYDWQPRDITRTFRSSCVINPSPFDGNIYLRDFYNVINEPVEIEIPITNIQSDYKIKQIAIQSNKSSEKLILTKGPYIGSLVFDTAGNANLTVTITSIRVSDNKEFTTTFTYNNILEIVKYYDEVDETHFYTDNTPLNLTYTSFPKISPNEWVTAESINTVIEAILETVQEIENRSSRYQNKSCFYAWIGGLDSTQAPIVWQDASCDITWKELECTTSFCSTNRTA